LIEGDHGEKPLPRAAAPRISTPSPLNLTFDSFQPGTRPRAPMPSPGATGAAREGRSQRESLLSQEKRWDLPLARRLLLRCQGREGDSGDARGLAGSPALTGFQEDDLVVLAELHEAVDALGKLHHVLDGVGDLQRALLPHGLAALPTQRGRPLGLAATLSPGACCQHVTLAPLSPPSPLHGAGKGPGCHATPSPHPSQLGFTQLPKHQKTLLILLAFLGCSTGGQRWPLPRAAVALAVTGSRRGPWRRHSPCSARRGPPRGSRGSTPGA